eukprot:Em0005g548a
MHKTKFISQFHSNHVLFDGLWIDMNEPSNFLDGSVDGCPTSSLEDPPFIPMGAHGGHWLGDNASEWPDLAISIPGILQFSIFGIPLVGADICGFNGNTTQELCTRWQQLGAFYPFSKNHNSLDSIVDNNTWDLDTQFMWGSALLISPVLTESTSSVKAYFPEGRCFNFRTGIEIVTTGQQTVLQAPYGYIPLHVRGGSVIPMQTPNTTTAQSLMNNYTLLIAPDGTGSASGYLYLDDGESLNTDLDNGFTLLQFTLNNSIFTRTVLSSGYTGADKAVVDVGKQTMLG